MKELHRVRDGVLWVKRGDFYALPSVRADQIALKNGYMYAEQLKKRFEGRLFFVDADTQKISSDARARD